MTEPGLCAGCVHGRPVATARGSLFWLCRRSATDRHYPRYPALPVLACPGFEPDGPSTTQPPRTSEPATE